jgi:uncharacterized protein (UPF0333 family)
MKGFIKSKKGLILLATLVVAAAAAVGGYAYFTNSGNGSNSAAQVGNTTNAFSVVVGNPANLDIPANGTTYYPTAAGSANRVKLSYVTTVTNQDEAAEATAQIVYSITTNQGGCTEADFSINGGTPGTDSTVPFVHDLAPNSDGAPTDQATNTATVQMIDSGGNQNACEGATVTLHAAVS